MGNRFMKASKRPKRAACALLVAEVTLASTAFVVTPLTKPQVAQAAGSKTYYSTIVRPSNPLFFFSLGDTPPTVTSSNPAYASAPNGQFCPQNGWSAAPAWFTDTVSGSSAYGWSCTGSSSQPGPFPQDSEVPNAQLWTTNTTTPSNLFTDIPDYAKCSILPPGQTCGPGDPYWNGPTGLPSYAATANKSLLVNFWAQLGSSTYCQTHSGYCGAPFTLWAEQWNSLPPQGGSISVFTPDNFQHLCFGDAAGGYSYTGNDPERFHFNGLSSMAGAECVSGSIVYGGWQMISIYFDGATNSMRLFIDGLLQGSPLTLNNWLGNIGPWGAILANNGPSDNAEWGQSHQSTASAGLWGYSEWYGAQATLVGNTYCGVNGNTLCPINPNINNDGSGHYSCNETTITMCTYLGYLYNAPGTGESPPPIGGAIQSGEVPPGTCAACAAASQGNWGAPVNTGFGLFWHTFTDLSIPGRGLALVFTHTYNANDASANGPLGYGWTYSYNMSLSIASTGAVTLNEETGAHEVFTPTSSGGYVAPPRVLSTLIKNADGSFTLTVRSRIIYSFSAAGLLNSERDLNGYTTLLNYNGSNQLTTIADPSGRSLALGWTGSHITSVTDANVTPSRAVAFTYDGSSGNLVDVIDVNGGHTHFGYDAHHYLTNLVDANCFAAGSACNGGGGLVNVYDGQGRVTSQTDDMGRATSFSYAGNPEVVGTTTITDPSGNVTQETYSFGERVKVIRGYGTSSAATTVYGFDPATAAAATVTDANGHTTTITYNAAGYVLNKTDALDRTTINTYDGLNDLLTHQDPLGEVTTSTYDSAGNLLSISRPLQGTSQVQTTNYSYGDGGHPGDVTSMQDPGGKVWTYGYDTYGSRQTVTDPLGHVSTTCYNAVGWKLASYTPKAGTIACAIPPPASTYRTVYSYVQPNGQADGFGDIQTITDPLSHSTSTTYDANRNITSTTDGDGNTTHYDYDFDNEQTDIRRADSSDLHTDFFSDGTVQDQKDGQGNAINTYAYDSLGRQVSATDALGNVTSFGYDSVGNRVSRQDPGGNCAATPKSGCTLMAHDADNELTGITYSDGATPDVTMAYDADGQRTSMTDGTGTSSWHWDSLGRLTSAQNGNGQVITYVYNLRGLVTSLGYPGSGKVVSRGYDDAGRWTSLSDWQSPVNAATFGYDVNGNLNSTTLPGGLTDTYNFNAADQLTSIADTKGSSSIFSANYSRDADGQLTADSSIPAAQAAYRYTVLNQLCYAGSANTSACDSPPSSSFVYSADSADNLVKNEDPMQTGPVTQAFNSADELCWTVQGSSSNGCSSAPAGATVYGYDSRGNRTTAGSVSYRYDQANRLVDYNAGQSTYRYNGDGLRMSKTASGTTTQFAWDVVSSPRLLLQQSVGSSATDFIYGPSGRPVEQVNPNPAAISRVGSPVTASDPTGTGGSLTLTLPAGVQPGDQIIAATTYPAHVGNSASVPAGYVAVTPPVNSGGTSATADVTQVFRKTATASDSSVTFSYSGSFSKAALVSVYRGVDALPVDVTAVGSAPSGTTVSATATTICDGDELLVVQGATYAGTGSGSWTAPSGMTEVAQKDATTTTIGLADGAQTSAGSTGALNSTFAISGVTLSGPQLTSVLLALRTPPKTLWLHHDRMGSTRAITDAFGVVEMAASYDPYGNPLTGAPWSAVSTPLLFSGEYRDSESGLYYLRARYYEPVTGQFLSRDPITALTLEPYGYVGDNPLNRTDASGLVFTTDGSQTFDFSALSQTAQEQYIALRNLIQDIFQRQTELEYNYQQWSGAGKLDHVKTIQRLIEKAWTRLDNLRNACAEAADELQSYVEDAASFDLYTAARLPEPVPEEGSFDDAAPAPDAPELPDLPEIPIDLIP
jgi:RHS repeat-associated protein